MTNNNQRKWQFKTARFALWSAAVLVLVLLAWCVAKVCATDKPRYSFHKPSTIFDNKTGKIYEISSDEKAVVEFDVVSGKKSKRVFATNLEQQKEDEANFIEATNALAKIAKNAAKEYRRQSEEEKKEDAAIEYDFYIDEKGFRRVPRTKGLK